MTPTHTKGEGREEELGLDLTETIPSDLQNHQQNLRNEQKSL